MAKVKYSNNDSYKFFGESISAADIRRTADGAALELRLTLGTDQMSVTTTENRSRAWEVQANRTFHQIDEFFSHFTASSFLHVLTVLGAGPEVEAILALEWRR